MNHLDVFPLSLLFMNQYFIKNNLRKNHIFLISPPDFCENLNPVVGGKNIPGRSGHYGRQISGGGILAKSLPIPTPALPDHRFTDEEVEEVIVLYSMLLCETIALAFQSKGHGLINWTGSNTFNSRVY